MMSVEDKKQFDIIKVIGGTMMVMLAIIGFFLVRLVHQIDNTGEKIDTTNKKIQTINEGVIDLKWQMYGINKDFSNHVEEFKTLKNKYER